jgi:predicted Zn-dependent protease
MGIILYRQKDYARAANILKDSSSQNPKDAELMYYLGMAQFSLNKKPESKQALQRALDLNLKPDLATEARKTLGVLK